MLWSVWCICVRGMMCVCVCVCVCVYACVRARAHVCVCVCVWGGVRPCFHCYRQMQLGHCMNFTIAYSEHISALLKAVAKLKFARKIKLFSGPQDES